ncbi:MAG: hypothetical protein LBR70_06600 [Lactobacillaceae bacterium]|jgi:hypothetical protein|nr:hypothetical protein [Lactobacillaceae bacterium]
MKTKILILAILLSFMLPDNAKAQRYDIDEELIFYIYSYDEDMRSRAYAEELKVHKKVLDFLEKEDMVSDFRIIAVDYSGGRAVYQEDGTWSEYDQLLIKAKNLIEAIVENCVVKKLVCVFDPYTDKLKSTEDFDDIERLIDSQ